MCRVRGVDTASVVDARDDMTVSRLVVSLLGASALFGCVAKVGQVSPAPRVLGDCRRFSYQIAPYFRSASRSDDRRIVELCNCCRDAEAGRKDKQGGMRIDRNRLRCQTGGPCDLVKGRLPSEALPQTDEA